MEFHAAVVAPPNGTLTGDFPRHLAGLRDLFDSASVPPDVIEQAADQLINGVSDAAGLLEHMTQTNPGAKAG
jgi:hypothetical protein